LKSKTEKIAFRRLISFRIDALSESQPDRWKPTILPEKCGALRKIMGAFRMGFDPAMKARVQVNFTTPIGCISKVLHDGTFLPLKRNL
jgi:hypothetical protein